jgi:ferrochelatase
MGLLVMAYGTPGDPSDIERYYTDIRRGRPPTAEQLADLVRRYDAIGGTSPLAERTEAQRRVLERALEERAPGAFDVVLGMKHTEPSIETAVAALADRGVCRVVALVLAPHYSALSVLQYLDRARAAAASLDLGVEAIESWHLEPAYLDFQAMAVAEARTVAPPGAKVVFTAHSLPARVLTMNDPYPGQLRESAGAIGRRLGLSPWTGWAVAYQSAGRTPEPWLGPDLLTVIDELGRSEGATGIVVCPCGFVADHLEVLYDLDIEARRRADDAGLGFARTRTLNDDPIVLAAIADKVIAASGVAA